jgi:hypothetical protein
MANPFFKDAANLLRRGIAAQQQEIAAKRREIDEKNKQAHQVIEHLKTQIRVVEADMARPPEKQDDPNTDRAQKNRIVLDKQKEIALKQRDFMLEKDRLLGEIKNQENDLINLEAQAKDLESRV